MLGSLLFRFTLGLAALLAFAIPPKVMGQYPGYPITPQFAPQQPPYGPYPPPETNMRDLEGTWYMSGHEEEPCEIIPSRRGDRALFINEKGGRAEGFLRGDRIIVPQWRIEGRYRGATIRWSNDTVWTR